MSKTKEELNTLKKEEETMNDKHRELAEKELVQVIGGQTVKPNVSGIIGSIGAHGAIVDIYGNIRPDINVVPDTTEMKKMDTLKGEPETIIFGNKN